MVSGGILANSLILIKAELSNFTGIIPLSTFCLAYMQQLLLCWIYLWTPYKFISKGNRALVAKVFEIRYYSCYVSEDMALLYSSSEFRDIETPIKCGGIDPSTAGLYLTTSYPLRPYLPNSSIPSGRECLDNMKGRNSDRRCQHTGQWRGTVRHF